MTANHLLEHFALLGNDRDDPQIGPWIDLERVPPWEVMRGFAPPRARREGREFRFVADLEGGEPGSPAVVLPVTMRPVKDIPRGRRSPWPDAPEIAVEAATGIVRFWP